jgi:hypothetical protein
MPRTEQEPGARAAYGRRRHYAMTGTRHYPRTADHVEVEIVDHVKQGQIATKRRRQNGS